jgi:hypothetical protein
MGYDCYNHLPIKTRKRDVEEFLTILGYERIKRGPFLIKNGTPFSYYRDEDYKYITGVLAEVFFDDDRVLKVHTRTIIWCSRYDLDFQNFTMRQLKKRFGGYFVSDLGRNRYFKKEGQYLEKAEAGCHQVYYRFYDNVQTVGILLQSAKDLGKGFPSIPGITEINILNPQIILANMLVPFLVSVLEEYFRSTYIALLKYSPKRESIIGNTRIAGDELITVDRGELSLEQVITRTKSFQDIKRICQSFKEIDSSLDIGGLLKKPYRGRKESIYETIERVILQRHEFIHNAIINPSYTLDQAERDANTIVAGVERIYRGLIKHHRWSDGYALYNTLSRRLGI